MEVLNLTGTPSKSVNEIRNILRTLIPSAALRRPLCSTVDMTPHHRSLQGSVVAIALAVISACAHFVSWDDSSKSWVGQPISKFAKLNGSATEVVPQGRGESEYRYDLPKLGSGCVHWWHVNNEGVIVGYRYQGSCRVIG